MGKYSAHTTTTALVCFLLTSAPALPSFAQQGYEPKGIGASAQKPLTNGDIITMAKAGLSEALIITTVRQAKNHGFVLTPDALIQLKLAGVSENILTVMVDPTATVSFSAPVPAASTAKPGSDSPTDPHEPGIYTDIGKNEPQLIQLEPTVFSEAKSGGVFASYITSGLMKTKWKAVVRGKTANQRVQMLRPVFYFYFEQKNAGLSNTGGFSNWFAGASSPNEFVLAKMDPKSGGRELIVGESGSLGASSGARSKDMVNLKIEKLAPGIYRVSPEDPLKVGGEYCFFYAGGGAMVGGGMIPGGGLSPAAMSGGANIGKLFDFGVDNVDVKVK